MKFANISKYFKMFRISLSGEGGRAKIVRLKLIQKVSHIHFASETCIRKLSKLCTFTLVSFYCINANLVFGI